MPIFFTSPSTESSHLTTGPPTRLIPSGLWNVGSCKGLAPAFYRGFPATPTFLLSSPSRFLVHYAQNPLSSRLLSKNTKVRIYRTIILPVVVYGCETWSLTLREERRLRVSENRVLRRMFWSKRDEVTGEWRKLYNEELNDLYSSSSTVWEIKSRIRWAGHIARKGRGEAYAGFW